MCVGSSRTRFFRVPGSVRRFWFDRMQSRAPGASRLRRRQRLAALVLPWLLSGCFEKVSITNKVTLKVLDGRTVRSSSAVWKTSYRDMERLPGNAYDVHIEGLPVEVALSKGRALFMPAVLPQGFPNRNAPGLADMSFPYTLKDRGRIARIRRLTRLVGARALVKCGSYIRSGVFPSIAQPDCMKVYISRGRSADFTRPLEPTGRDRDIRVVSVEIEIVDDGVSVPVDKVLIFPTST